MFAAPTLCLILRKALENVYDAEFAALSNGAKMKLIALLEKSLEQEN